jgi:hypothetical protein
MKSKLARVEEIGADVELLILYITVISLMLPVVEEEMGSDLGRHEVSGIGNEFRPF